MNLGARGSWAWTADGCASGVASGHQEGARACCCDVCEEEGGLSLLPCRYSIFLKHDLRIKQIKFVCTKAVLGPVQLRKPVLIGDPVDVPVDMCIERVDEGRESKDKRLDPPYKGGLSLAKRSSFHFVAELVLPTLARNSRERQTRSVMNSGSEISSLSSSPWADLKKSWNSLSARCRKRPTL